MKLSFSVLILRQLERAGCKAPSERTRNHLSAPGANLAVIENNLHKMVIVEYPIAGVPCQFLTFFSPGSGRRVQKYCGVGVDGGKARRVQRCRPGVRAA